MKSAPATGLESLFGMRKLLVTGSRGFVGRALQSYLESNHEYAIELVQPDSRIEIMVPAKLNELIAGITPEFVIHLAAQSSVPESFEDPRSTLNTNLFGTLNLLESLKHASFRGRLLYVGSADVYGSVPLGDIPIRESQPLRPLNPYAVSKVAAEALCYQWVRASGQNIVMVRPFNHIGPGQSEHFVVSDFAKQVIEIKFGLRPPVIMVGDVDVTRDFTDVRDVIRAYLLLLERGEDGEVYNVCSGRETSVRDILEMQLAMAGINAEIRKDSRRLRQIEQRRVVASYEKLHQATGWRPEITLEQSIKDILADWEKRLVERKMDSSRK